MTLISVISSYPLSPQVSWIIFNREKNLSTEQLEVWERTTNLRANPKADSSVLSKMSLVRHHSQILDALSPGSFRQSLTSSIVRLCRLMRRCIRVLNWAVVSMSSQLNKAFAWPIAVGISFWGVGESCHRTLNIGNEPTGRLNSIRCLIRFRFLSNTLDQIAYMRKLPFE